MVQIYSVVGQKGGLGKSMVARELFFCLRHSKYKTLLIDCDVKQNSNYNFAKKYEARNKELLDVKALAAKDLRESLRGLIRQYDSIVIDCGGRISDELKMAICCADKVIMPIDPMENDEISNVEAVIDEISDLDCEFFILPNKVSTHPFNNDLQEFKKKYDGKLKYFRILNSYLHERRIYKKARAEGFSIYENRNLNAIEEFNNFIIELFEND